MSNGKTEENSHSEREMSTGKTEENSQIEKMGETESKKVKGSTTESRKVKGSVVLMKKNYVLCCKNIIASFIDRIYELLGKRVSMQLISSVHPDPGHSLSLIAISISCLSYISGICHVRTSDFFFFLVEKRSLVLR